MAQLQCNEGDVLQIFEALDHNRNKEVGYSDFVAAMLDGQLDLSDRLLEGAFHRLDIDGSGIPGKVSVGSVCRAIGGQADDIEAISCDGDGYIHYNKFAAFLRGTVPSEDNQSNCSSSWNHFSSSTAFARRLFRTYRHLSIFSPA